MTTKSQEASTDAEATLEPGDPLCGGRFVVVRHIGSGGVGAAYLARDTVLDCVVVCKVAHDATTLSWGEMRLQFDKLVRMNSRDIVKP